ncbi:hypothetical protein LVO79_16340 [Roseivivax marinus]|jgi:hypothetical protein|nr:hypothetical protein [Roseivivax marinus]UMA64552.1 hypothetical protein LVO79_16340 [Roseivivax marinus]SEL53236.1 hypothetical protein SAMN05444413_11068 [Roseivivax marinus]
MFRAHVESLRAFPTERPAFATDGEPLGIFGLEALIDRITWRTALGECPC